MKFQTPFALTRKPYVGDTYNADGIAIPSFGAPVAVPVISISPHVEEKGSDTATETVVADLDVFMPKVAVKLKDRFVVDDDDHDVVGIKDWTKGFHGWQPGIVVELRRVA